MNLFDSLLPRSSVESDKTAVAKANTIKRVTAVTKTGGTDLLSKIDSIKNNYTSLFRQVSKRV